MQCLPEGKGVRLKMAGGLDTRKYMVRPSFLFSLVCNGVSFSDVFKAFLPLTPGVSLGYRQSAKIQPSLQLSNEFFDVGPRFSSPRLRSYRPT